MLRFGVEEDGTERLDDKVLKMDFAESDGSLATFAFENHHHFHGDEASRELSVVQVGESFFFDENRACLCLDPTAQGIEQSTHSLVLSQVKD